MKKLLSLLLLLFASIPVTQAWDDDLPEYLLLKLKLIPEPQCNHCCLCTAIQATIVLRRSFSTDYLWTQRFSDDPRVEFTRDWQSGSLFLYIETPDYQWIMFYSEGIVPIWGYCNTGPVLNILPCGAWYDGPPRPAGLVGTAEVKEIPYLREDFWFFAEFAQAWRGTEEDFAILQIVCDDWLD